MSPSVDVTQCRCQRSLPSGSSLRPVHAPITLVGGHPCASLVQFVLSQRDPVRQWKAVPAAIRRPVAELHIHLPIVLRGQLNSMTLHYI